MQLTFEKNCIASPTIFLKFKMFIFADTLIFGSTMICACLPLGSTHMFIPIFLSPVYVASYADPRRCNLLLGLMMSFLAPVGKALPPSIVADTKELTLINSWELSSDKVAPSPIFLRKYSILAILG